MTNIFFPLVNEKKKNRCNFPFLTSAFSLFLLRYCLLVYGLCSLPLVLMYYVRWQVALGGKSWRKQISASYIILILCYSVSWWSILTRFYSFILAEEKMDVGSVREGEEERERAAETYDESSAWYAFWMTQKIVLTGSFRSWKCLYNVGTFHLVPSDGYGDSHSLISAWLAFDSMGTLMLHFWKLLHSGISSLLHLILYRLLRVLSGAITGWTSIPCMKR